MFRSSLALKLPDKSAAYGRTGSTGDRSQLITYGKLSSSALCSSHPVESIRDWFRLGAAQQPRRNGVAIGKFRFLDESYAMLAACSLTHSRLSPCADWPFVVTLPLSDEFSQLADVQPP